ncbi:MAG: peptidase [Verrucomicrobiales bacterium]|nr:peptidase [Verrucomicrobiales bacterium]
MTIQIAPFGTWKSPLSAQDVAQASIRISALSVTSESVFWAERRPQENGRTAIVESHHGERIERLDAPWNVRTRVHEYGGGAFLAEGRTLYFSSFDDGRVYAQPAGGTPIALTPEVTGPRVGYADFIYDGHRNRLVAIREAHQAQSEPVASVVSISLEPVDGGPPQIETLASGADFYSSPALSADGGLLAWLTWTHPNMPWDGTRLWLSDLDQAGAPKSTHLVAGSDSESIFQPGFDGAGTLIFATDKSDWWNLNRVSLDDLASPFKLEPMAAMEAEFAAPQWGFGMSTWCEVGPGQIVSAYTQDGVWRLAALTDGDIKEIQTPYSTIDAVQSDGAGKIFFIGGSPTKSAELVCLDLNDQGAIDVLNDVKDAPLPTAYVSVGEAISYPSADGRVAHAFFYPPCNPGFRADEGQLPPLVVKSHGGPTSSTDNALDPGIQFWTTRGFAVVDVNYGGSTGYGREYRETLKGQWGIVDVEDCSAAATYLSDNERVDSKRMAIRGGSAGGYTTLACLAFTDVFQTGASHFGVADLEALAQDTHKFESRYLDGLVGPYPERKDLYKSRAPLHAAHQISCPVIFFQGLDDKVVPPNQAELMVAALNENGIPNQHVTFEGEGHGFRKAENIASTLNTELAFYLDVFNSGD